MYAYTNGISATNTTALLASIKVGAQVGGNGGGTTNDVGFIDSTNYTFVMTIANHNNIGTHCVL